MKAVAIALALLSAVQAQDLNATRTQFADFKRMYGRVYTSAEKEARALEAFAATLERVATKNAAEGASIFGVTKFADMTMEEFAATMLTYKPKALAQRGEPRVVADTPDGLGSDPPSHWDWRDQGIVTPVKDQGQCGGCWAFSATEAYESAWAQIPGKSLTAFSEQQVISCDTVDGGCDGGDSVQAWSYIASAGGLATEANYPFTDADGSGTSDCRHDFKVKGGNVTGFTYLTKPCWSGKCDDQNEEKLKKHVASVGAPSICVDASSWNDYTGGIMTPKSCSGKASRLDHCVQLVGYHKEESEEDAEGGDSEGSKAKSYWIVRNTWNTDWGNDGYIYLKMGENTCGVADEASVPVLAAEPE